MHCAKAGIPVDELQQGLSLLTMPRKSGRGSRDSAVLAGQPLPIPMFA